MPEFVGTPGNDTLTGTNDGDLLDGREGNDHLLGLAGADLLIGGSGDDVMEGGPGNDHFYVDSGMDVVVESASGGDDTVSTGVDYALPADAVVETLTTIDASAVGALRLTGNGYAQSIYGNAGNNLIDGQGGLDFLVGGAGNDTYVIFGEADAVAELSGEGDDVILVDQDYSLSPGAAVETMVATDGTSPIHLIGNDFGQSLYGNAGANQLNGGGGVDYLVGGLGNDIYFIDTPADVVVEQAAAGNDLVIASSDYTLPAEVENLRGPDGSSLAINLTGNDLANNIQGTDGNNVIKGGAGDDILIGAGGADVLIGGSGIDRLQGGSGNDAYIIDAANDLILEGSSEGDNDLISTSVSYKLAEGVWVEVLAALDSAGGLSLAGNQNANTIYGNDSDNVLAGGGGADYLVGRGGNDIYHVTDGRETIAELESGGNDTVYAATSYTLNFGAHVEVLSTVSQAATDFMALTGNELANTVVGNAGTNILNGGAGHDVLAGLAGADRFEFTQIGDANADQISDFQAGVDTIGLVDTTFTALATGQHDGITVEPLPASAFRAGTAAQDADDRIIYDPASGAIWYDADGTGTAQMVLFACVAPNSTLSAADFQIVSYASQSAAQAGSIGKTTVADWPADHVGHSVSLIVDGTIEPSSHVSHAEVPMIV